MTRHLKCAMLRVLSLFKPDFYLTCSLPDQQACVLTLTQFQLPSIMIYCDNEE